MCASCTTLDWCWLWCAGVCVCVCVCMYVCRQHVPMHCLALCVVVGWQLPQASGPHFGGFLT